MKFCSLPFKVQINKQLPHQLSSFFPLKVQKPHIFMTILFPGSSVVMQDRTEETSHCTWKRSAFSLYSGSTCKCSFLCSCVQVGFLCTCVQVAFFCSCVQVAFFCSCVQVGFSLFMCASGNASSLLFMCASGNMFCSCVQVAFC